MEESPNWVEMPDELMANILGRLPTVELLKSARRVCTTWRRICKDSAMWKVIHMRIWFHSRDRRGTDYVLETLTKQAVDLSCGELIDISIQGFGTDQLLDYILLRSNKLKRLCLRTCYSITDSRLSQAVKMVPHLEELCLSDSCIEAKDLEVIGRNCPQLKSFELSNLFHVSYDTCDGNACAIANSMPKLRSLKLMDEEMTETGLGAILQGCQHIDTLHVRMCPNVDLDGNLGKLCMERIKDFEHEWQRKCSLHLQFSDEEDLSEGDLSETGSDMYDDYSESDSYEDGILLR